MDTCTAMHVILKGVPEKVLYTHCRILALYLGIHLVSSLPPVAH